MKHVWITGLLFLVGLASTAAASTGAHLDQALAAFKRGELKAVLEHAKAVSTDDEDYPRVQYLVGETQLLLDDLRASEIAFNEVLDRRPEAIPALVGLGRALTLQGGYESAEIHLSAAVELDPKDVAAKRAMGDLLMRTDRMKEARKVLAAARKLDPTGPMTVRALFELELRADDMDAAEKLAAKLVKSQKKHPMGHFLMGIVHERDKKTEKAIADYQAAIELDPKFLDAHKNLAILCHTMSNTYQIEERNVLALAHYAAYFELGGKDPQLERTYRQLKGYLDSRPKD